MSLGTSPASPIEVLIVDDHPVVRDGLRAAIGAQSDMRLVGEARDGIEAEEEAARLNPHVLLMDINMPRRSGIDAMLNIKRKQPAVKVLLLTVSELGDDLVQAMRFGSDGYLLKKTEITQVLDAIRRVVAGEAVLSEEMTGKLMAEFRRTGEEPALSPREREVLSLIGEGLTTAEIADRLFISRGSASTYVHRIIGKLHFRSKAEAMAYSLRHTPLH